MLSAPHALLALAFAALAVARPQAAAPKQPNTNGIDALLFTNTNIKVTDTAPGKIAFKINRPLKGAKPRVWLTGDNVLFAKQCFVDIDDDKEKSIEIYAKPDFTGKGDKTSIISFLMSWKDLPEFHNKTQQLSITRTVTDSRTCSAIGDPHYTSFDGKQYNFMGKKCYMLLESPTLVVQARHADYWADKNAAINVGAAIVFGDSAYMVNALAPKLEDRLVLLTPGKTAGLTVKKDATLTDIQFFTDDGAQVKLTISGGGTAQAYINIFVVLPACYKGKTKGLCGVFDDNQANDMTLRAGGITGDAVAFGNSWELKPEEDLFVKGGTADFISKMQKVPVTQDCAHPKDPATVNAFGIAPVEEGYNTAPVTALAAAPNLPPPAVVTVTGARTDKEFEDFARKVCTKAVNLPGLEGVPAATNVTLPPLKNYVEDCVSDCKLGGSLGTVDSFRIAFQRAVRTVLDAAMAKFKICEKTGLPRARKDTEVAAWSKSLGFGSFTCPAVKGGDYEDDKVCNSKGSCKTYGCECEKGFSMFDCSYDLSKEVIPAAAKAAAVPESEYRRRR